MHQGAAAETTVRAAGGIEEAAAGPDLTASVAYARRELVGPSLYHCGADCANYASLEWLSGVFARKTRFPSKAHHYRAQPGRRRDHPAAPRRRGLDRSSSCRSTASGRPFSTCARWPRWNPCIWRARVRGGELREGAHADLGLQPDRARATSTSCRRSPRSWSSCRTTGSRGRSRAPGFHAVHAYRFAALGGGPLRASAPGRSRKDRPTPRCGASGRPFPLRLPRVAGRRATLCTRAPSHPGEPPHRFRVSVQGPRPMFKGSFGDRIGTCRCSSSTTPTARTSVTPPSPPGRAFAAR